MKKQESEHWDKIAKNYESEIISPILHDQKELLAKGLKTIKDKANKTVIDWGCGRGYLLPKLGKNFKHVYGIDISESMLEEAQKNIGLANNISLLSGTLGEKFPTNFLDLKADLALSLNSLIMPSPDHRQKALMQITRHLKDNGRFIAVMPALECIRETYRETYHRKFQKFKSIEKAEHETNISMEAHRINWPLGLYHTDDMIQKYYLKSEIRKAFKAAGLCEITFAKTQYPKSYSFNYYDNYRTLPTMYDWFIEARKK